MSRQKSHRTRGSSRHSKKPRGSRPTVIAGETAPDERNANVQQSEKTSDASEGDPWGDNELLKPKRRGEGVFSPEEVGDADEAQRLESDNPSAVQSGLGPLGQEGEGNRQNAEYEELTEESPPDVQP
jgi:hypothetical protein